MLLETGRIRLDPLCPSDYETLVALESEPRLGARWRHGTGTLSPRAAIEGMWRGVLEQRVIRRSGESYEVPPLGVAVAYDANLRCGTCYIGVMARPELQKHGLAFAGLALFIEYLFSDWGLRQLYAEVHEYNYQAYQSGEGVIFHRIGCLEEHTALFGRRWDLYLLCITRSEWFAGPSRLLRARVREGGIGSD